MSERPRPTYSPSRGALAKVMADVELSDETRKRAQQIAADIAPPVDRERLEALTERLIARQRPPLPATPVKPRPRRAVRKEAVLADKAQIRMAEDMSTLLTLLWAAEAREAASEERERLMVRLTVASLLIAALSAAGTIAAVVA